MSRLRVVEAKGVVPEPWVVVEGHARLGVLRLRPRQHARTPTRRLTTHSTTQGVGPSVTRRRLQPSHEQMLRHCRQHEMPAVCATDRLPCICALVITCRVYLTWHHEAMVWKSSSAPLPRVRTRDTGPHTRDRASDWAHASTHQEYPHTKNIHTHTHQERTRSAPAPNRLEESAASLFVSHGASLPSPTAHVCASIPMCDREHSMSHLGDAFVEHCRQDSTARP